MSLGSNVETTNEASISRSPAVVARPPPAPKRCSVLWYGLTMFHQSPKTLKITGVASDIVCRLHKKYSEIFRTRMLTTDSHETIPWASYILSRDRLNALFLKSIAILPSHLQRTWISNVFGSLSACTQNMCMHFPLQQRRRKKNKTRRTATNRVALLTMKIIGHDNAVFHMGQRNSTQSFWNKIPMPSREHMFNHRSKESKSSIRKPLWFHFHRLYI